MRKLKIEREDTEPLVGSNDDFASLLTRGESFQLPRFDTEEVNALPVEENPTYQLSRDLSFPPETYLDIVSLTDVKLLYAQTVNETLTEPPPFTSSLLTLGTSDGGLVDFKVMVNPDTKDRNKICFSQTTGKLYVTPNYVAPISLYSNTWEGASVDIMPLFKEPQHRRSPVPRCYNCTQQFVYDSSKADFVVHVEDEHAQYHTMQGHKIVTLPIAPPPAGQPMSTVLIKLTCLQSCTGGPERRPFGVLFNFKINGTIVGHQILDVKCCKCPGRDMNNEEKVVVEPKGSQKPTKVRKISLSDACEKKAKRICVKTEPESSKYVTIQVPKEFEKKVKHYLNSLVAHEYVLKTNSLALPFPNL